jgi:hypothetical protein
MFLDLSVEEVVLLEQSILHLQVLNPPNLFDLLLASLVDNFSFTSAETIYIPMIVPISYDLYSKTLPS